MEVGISEWLGREERGQVGVLKSAAMQQMAQEDNLVRQTSKAEHG